MSISAPYAYKVRRWFDLAATERVGCVLIENSNTGFSNYGYTKGYAKALYGLGLPIWGSGPQALGFGTSVNPIAYSSNTVLANTGAPAELAAYGVEHSGIGDGYTGKYAYLADAATVANGTTFGLTFSGASNYGHAANPAIRFRMWYRTFATATGSGIFRVRTRQANSPYTTLTTYDQQTTVTGTDGWTSSDYATAANADSGLGVQFFPSYGGVGMTGPFFSVYGSIDITTATTGFALCPMVYHTGGNITQLDADVTNAGATARRGFFSKWLELLGPSKAMLVFIGESQNSASLSIETATFTAKVQSIMATVRADWEAVGGGSNLFFVLSGNHPTASPDNAFSIGYRDAEATLAASETNTACVRAHHLIHYDEMYQAGGANTYYSGTAGATPAHLTNLGYDRYCEKVIKSLYPQDAAAFVADLTLHTRSTGKALRV
jgi:hypothetical protein